MSLSYIDIAVPGSGGGSNGSSVLTIDLLDSQAANAKGVGLTGSVLAMQSAGATFPGLVNNTTQSFAGAKTFLGNIAALNLSGTNTGDVTIGTADGLTLTAQALSLVAATATNTGALTSTDWSTFNGKLNNPLSAAGDIMYDALGAVGNTRLPIGSANQVLAISSSLLPQWQTPGPGISLPTAGDMVYEALAAAGFTKLPIGTANQLMAVSSSLIPSWLAIPLSLSLGGMGATNAITGFNNLSPLTTSGDLIYEGLGTTGNTRLPIGATGGILFVGSSLIPTWAAPPLGLTVGGLGGASFLAYAVLCGGTTSTSPVQGIAAVGSSGQVLTSNGSALPTFQGIPAAATVRHYVIVTVGNGHGSTNTKIRRFTTTSASAGSDITYADSATNGGSFTINNDGIYSITYNDNKATTACVTGVSVNTSQPTVSSGSLTYAQGLRIAGTVSNAAVNSGCSVTLFLSANDVVRAHTDGGPNASDGTCIFIICKVNN